MQYKEKSVKISNFALLSIFGSIITIILKYGAYYYTNSVGLLSDAMESLVNLVGAVLAFWMLKISLLPEDKTHSYGHNKAEYFSSIVEGILIIFAAINIIYISIQRMLYAKELEQIYVGLFISILASLVNLFIALVLFKAAKKYNSISLKANATHLMTDVFTTVGIIISLILILFTKIKIIDPIIALLVALNIIYSGYVLIKNSIAGFMDASLPMEEQEILLQILKDFVKNPLKYNNFKTRIAGSKRFVSFCLLVPADWSVKKGHDLLDDIEMKMKNSLSNISVITHLEPLK